MERKRRKLKVKKHKAVRITLEERTSMFMAFQNSCSVHEVSRITGKSRATVDYWRVRDDWDERITRIEGRVEDKLEKKVVDRRLRNVQVLDQALDSIKDQLDDGKKVSIAFLGKFAMVQEMLISRGAADSEKKLLSESERAALQLLTTLGEKGIKQLGDALSGKIDITNKVGALPAPKRHKKSPKSL